MHCVNYDFTVIYEKLLRLEKSNDMLNAQYMHFEWKKIILWFFQYIYVADKGVIYLKKSQTNKK